METNKKIDITVAVPTYDSKNILWLQLESLCRQVTQYNWELIVCEEHIANYCGKEYILQYEDRLKKAGCKNIIYIPLTEKIPLSKKWVVIANKSKGNTFILAASDNYSSPDRLEISHKKILEGYDWFDVGTGLFLHLPSFTNATYTNNPGETGLFMTTKTDLIKKLKGPWPNSRIDIWIRQQLNILKRYRHPNPVLGLHTDGENKISIGRKNQYVNGKYGRYFKKSIQHINDILPLDVLNKLNRKFNFEKI